MAWEDPTVARRPTPDDATRTMAGRPGGGPPDGPDDRDWFERVQRPIVTALVVAIAIAVGLLVTFVFVDDDSETPTTTTVPSTVATTAPSTGDGEPVIQTTPPSTQASSTQAPSTPAPTESTPPSSDGIPPLTS